MRAVTSYVGNTNSERRKHKAVISAVSHDRNSGEFEQPFRLGSAIRTLVGKPGCRRLAARGIVRFGRVPILRQPDIKATAATESNVRKYWAVTD